MEHDSNHSKCNNTNQELDTHKYYINTWKNVEIEYSGLRNKNKLIIVFMEDTDKCKNILEKLKAQSSSNNIVEVSFGQQFIKINEFKYIITENYNGYRELFKELNCNISIKIIHLATCNNFTIETSKELEHCQSQGVMSLFFIVKLILRMKQIKKAEIILVSQYINEITGTEKILCPQFSTMFGLAKAVNIENRNIKCRCIDFDDETDIDKLINEVNSKYKSFLTAYRNNHKYIEIIRSLNFKCNQSDDKKYFDGKTYLITGGTGGLGLKIAKYISTKCKANICLLNRSTIPNRDMWNLYLRSNNNTDNLSRKIRGIKEIENNGSKVLLYSADISKENEVSPVISKIISQFNSIDTIIHCAGTAVDNNEPLIRDQTESYFKSVLDAKVYGTWIINKLTQKYNVNKFILFSSVITIIPSIHSAAYTASNSFLDSFTFYNNKLNRNTLTVNWPAWKYSLNYFNLNIKEYTQLFKFISTQNAINWLENISDSKVKKVIIGNLNYGSNPVFFEEILPFTLSDEIHDVINKHYNTIDLTGENNWDAILENKSIH